MKKLSRGCAATVAAVLGLSLSALPATADDLTPPQGSTPVVGMAVEPGSSEVWLAGPGADSGRIVNAETGQMWSFSGDPVSVQALAWSDGRLWVADLGDERRTRDHVVVFRLGVPESGRSTYHAFDFEYEDGPRDAKAMLISGRGNIYIVSAGEDPGIYRAPREPSRQSMNTLTRVADAPEGVTDGVFLTDGSTMALRTGTGITYIDAFTWEELVTDTIVGAPEGESITVDQDDKVLVGGNPTIRTAQVPASDTTTTVTPRPESSSSPSGTTPATPAASASPEPDGDTADRSGPDRSGTITAVALAGLLALAAGVVTFAVRR